MGFVEGIATAIGMTIAYLISSDMTTVILTGISCIAFFMKGDKD